MLENRTIVIIAIGYIIGILMGLYCKISIVFLYLIGFFIYLMLKKPPTKKFKIISYRRYFRYIKIIFTKKVIFTIIIISIISNTITLYQNYRYENLYSNFNGQKITVIATVVSNPKEKEYKNVYKIKIETINGSTKYKNTYLYLNVKNTLKIDLEYGAKLQFTGEFSEPSSRRNYKGFDYKEYLKTLKIYGTVDLNKIESQSDANKISIFKFSNSIFLKIKDLIQENFEIDEANLLLGILLGYTDEIDEDIKLSFQDSNVSHVLAVSGMHVSFVIIFLKLFLEKLIGKRANRIFTVFVLIGYMFITGFASSVVRAVIMGILGILASIFHRRSDIWQNISLALLILLIYNPFLIESTSMWLTFIGTVGILTISVYVFIPPIMAICFNKVAITSIFMGMIICIFIGPITILGFVFVLFYNILDFLNLKSLFINLISLIINLVIDLSNVGSNLPFSQIYVVTPSILVIVLYYIIVFVIWFFYSIYKSNSPAKFPSAFRKRVKNLVSLLIYRFNQNKRKIISIILIISVLGCFLKIMPKDLKIYFIDVGQGDATLIVTPKNKKILIDGGGSEFRDL